MVLKVSLRGDDERIVGEAQLDKDTEFVVSRDDEEYLVIRVTEKDIVIGHTKGKSHKTMEDNLKRSPEYAWNDIVPKLGEESTSLLHYLRLIDYRTAKKTQDL